MASSFPSTAATVASRFSRKEREVCVWLNQHFQCTIDPSDKATLVAALADGVVLCKLIRGLTGRKNIKFTASSPTLFQRYENIRTFSTACEQLGLSKVATLSPSDLRDGVSDLSTGVRSRVSRHLAFCWQYHPPNSKTPTARFLASAISSATVSHRMPIW